MKDDWGLATGENVLFGSDETSTLYLINRQNSKVIGKHIVTYNGHEVHNLNELEYIHGEVWANVWLTDGRVGDGLKHPYSLDGLGW